MLIKLTTTIEGGGKGRGESKRNYRANQNIRIINVSIEYLLSASFPLLGVIVHLTSVRCPQHCSGLWTCCGAAQTLIWSCCYVLLPQMFTAVRTGVFSLAGALSGLFYTPQAQSLPCWSCGFNLQVVQLVGRLWVFHLSHTSPWVSIVVLFPPLRMGHPLGFAPEAALEDLGVPLWGPGVEVVQVQLLGSWGLWQHQVLRGVGVYGSRNTVL